MPAEAWIGSIESGIIFALMALGVYLTFRILDVPDLTVDGSFTTGGALAATMIAAGYNPLISTAAALVAGGIAGLITGLLHTKGKINALLAGILSMIALYSINLRIMGKANVPLLGEETLFSQITAFFSGGYGIMLTMAVFVLAVKLITDWFLHTEIGLALRATGDNERMIRSFSTNTDTTKIIGLSLSNALVALSGALMAQYQGFSDVNMGIGMIVIGLASVIIGETLFGHSTIFRATLAVVLGAIVYRVIIAIALRVEWLEASDMKLITAVIVVIALTWPKLWGAWKEKRARAALQQQSSQDNTAVRGDHHA